MVVRFLLLMFGCTSGYFKQIDEYTWTHWLIASNVALKLYNILYTTCKKVCKYVISQNQTRFIPELKHIANAARARAVLMAQRRGVDVTVRLPQRNTSE